jgi:hypothetical protein
MACRGARAPVRLLTKQRVLAALVVTVLVAPALTECAGWAVSAAGRHVCCGNRGGMAPETRMTDCCAMSEQSNEATPPDAQSARPFLKLVDLHFLPLADTLAARPPISLEHAAARRAAVVPLYLRQASLLI